MESGQRVTVLDGPFKGAEGAVIRDDRDRDLGLGAAKQPWIDQVWVLMDVGDNPVRYSGERLAAI